MKRMRPRLERQHGAALLIILAIIVTGGIATLLAFAVPRAITDDADVITKEALAEARSALILRAAMDDNRPGSLPCPDTNNDGIAELLVGNACPAYVGRLPWQTLGLPDLRDASGERFWYALPASLRDDTSAQPINSVSIGTPQLLSTIGSVPTQDVAAVVIAPGRPLPGQTRDPAGENNVANYLEDDNANADSVYQTSPKSLPFNDTAATITREQLFQVVERRVASEVRVTLQKYYMQHGYYPFANDFASGSFACTNNQTRGRLPNPDYPVTAIADTCPNNNWGVALSPPPPAWFFANDWHRLTYYSLAPACKYTTPACSGAGFLTVNGTGGVHAVVIVGSRALTGQVRPCGSANDCIEQPLAASDQYQIQALSASYNDRFALVKP